MAGLGGILLEKDILLESGTNEVELLVFRVGEIRLGVNVAKVREVLTQQTIVRTPQAHPSVLGCFRVRNLVVPCVSLRKHLGIEPQEIPSCKLILTEFNRSQTAFVVDEVERIHRLNWGQIATIPALVASAESPVTGVATIEGRLVSILDFEAILADVCGQTMEPIIGGQSVSEIRSSRRLVLVDDSPNVRKTITTTLRNNGYVHVTAFENGRLAWEWLEQQLAAGKPPAEIADVLITDVEMPMMDGLHLTRRIKEHAQLKQLPVVLFSSIMTPDNQKKGTAVGADAQLTKPEFGRLVEIVDELLKPNHDDAQAANTASSPAARPDAKRTTRQLAGAAQ